MVLLIMPVLVYARSSFVVVDEDSGLVTYAQEADGLTRWNLEDFDRFLRRATARRW